MNLMLVGERDNERGWEKIENIVTMKKIRQLRGYRGSIIYVC